jgi:putative transposase
MDNRQTLLGAGHAALRRGRSSQPGHVYHVTATTQGRALLFAEFGPAASAAATFERTRLLGDARMLAWVLMPDHAHWLLQLGAEDSLHVLVGKLKSASGRSANLATGRIGRVWQPAFHDHALRGESDLRATARYIVANPLRAGLVSRIGDYPFWNAVWL